MYVLFSLSTLLFLGIGCEQRPELGKSVEFASEKTKEISVEEPVNTEVQTETRTTTSENVDSENSEEEVQSETSDEKEADKVSDSFEEDSFRLDSSDMGKLNTSPKNAPEPTQNPEIVNAIDANQPTSLIKNQVWPIQVIGILDSTPKRATLRRSNGSEISVQAGHVLGEERLVVLAIGKNHVSLAQIHPRMMAWTSPPG